jgi:polysaccharide biosynthesis transport protein
MMGAHQILPLLWRRRWTLSLTALAAFAAVAALTFTLPRVYTSQAYLLVAPSEASGSDFAATQLTQILTKTYSELLQTESVSAAVDRRVGIEGSSEAISVTAVPQSQLLAIEAEAESPGVAREIANGYASVFASRVQSLSEADRTAGTVSVAEPGSLPTSPTRPRPLLYLTLGALLAVLAGIGAALLRERLDQRILLDSATTEIFGVPIIGRLPRGMNRPGGASALAESSRLLLANLSFANLGERPRSIAVVSASEEEGKSTCTLSIGRAAAEIGIDVLVVEADLRRPGLLAKLPGVPARSAQGLATALLRPEVLLTEQVVGVPESTLDVMPAGPIPPNPAALLGGDRMADFNRRAGAQYELVIYDTPPFSAGADAALVSSVAESVVLVVDATKTRRARVLQAVEQLRRSRAHVLGVVVNRAPDAVDSYYYEPEAGERRSGGRSEEAVLAPQASAEPARRGRVWARGSRQ